VPRLILGPLLRYVGETEATVWVETDAACEVEVLGRTARTFQVAGHHYALVVLDGLAPGTAYPYQVRLDGAPAWPEPGQPASVLRTLAPTGAVRLVFGSCRVAAPHAPPWSVPSGDGTGVGRDALRAYALRLRGAAPERWPALLLLVGDQVYADATGPEVRAFIRSRRDPGRPPGLQVADFEEFTRLYRVAWSDPPVRWLLSTVPSAMICDDHDVHDNWNCSAAWLAAMRATSWWQERVTGGLMAYWLYQHLGNLAPAELAADPTYQAVTGAAGQDAGAWLRQQAAAWDQGRGGRGFSHARRLGAARLVAVDVRGGRVLAPERELVAGAHWREVDRWLAGDADHLLVVSSLPWLLAPAAHHLEAWNESVCAGAWGRRLARLGERLRQRLALEHWAAFAGSFDRLAAAVGEVGAGRRGAPPSTVLVLSGDVHYCYLAGARWAAGAGVRSRVYQVVCSPLRNRLSPRLRLATRVAMLRPVAWAWRVLARLAGAAAPPLRWRVLAGPCFDNQVATLDLDGRAARLRVERVAGGSDDAPGLAVLLDRDLAGSAPVEPGLGSAGPPAPEEDGDAGAVGPVVPGRRRDRGVVRPQQGRRRGRR
jgi:PhoD-like phosphatase